MSRPSNEKIEVYLDLNGQLTFVGLARFNRRRGILTTDFIYDSAYMGRLDGYAIDPALPIERGTNHVQGLPGAFSDCAPDRWGRRLIERRIRETETAGSTPRSVGEVDYLLGVSDETRQGALHFLREDERVFADADSDVPKKIELPKVLRAAEQVASDPSGGDFAAIKVLLDAGTGTLGGARPKASVVDGDRLMIAKFPHHADSWDVMAWEATALDLAEEAGITVPKRNLVNVDGRHVLLLDRFDREGGKRDGKRIGFMSAMTLLQASDGVGQDYTDLAEALSDHSSAPDADLRELWRRIAFSIAVNNTDDHMRNHAVLRDRNGWRLSPAFDINPNPDVTEERTTAVGGVTGRARVLEILTTWAYAFGLTDRDVATVLSEVFEATSRWRQVAASNGVPAAQIPRFEAAFEGLRSEAHRIITTR